MTAPDLFHTGLRVADLDAAMADLGKGTGLEWAPAVEQQRPVWSPERGAHTIGLRFTYSTARPHHVELLQGEPGSIWDGIQQPGVHHTGVWVDDVAATTERLLEEVWTLELAGGAPEEGYGSFSYVRSPSGLLLEPVASAVQPRFERWWGGADLA